MIPFQLCVGQTSGTGNAAAGGARPYRTEKRLAIERYQPATGCQLSDTAHQPRKKSAMPVRTSAAQSAFDWVHADAHLIARVTKAFGLR